jgi:outer membrane immunogenic protein
MTLRQSLCRGLIAAAVSLLALPALAAPPTFDWSGLYFGVQGGLATPSFSATGTASADPLGSISVTQSYGGPSAGEIGVFAGFNFQNAGGLVFGGEADFNWVKLQGTSGPLFDLTLPSGTCTSGVSSSYICVGPVSTAVNWYGTVRGTVGQSFGQLLLYGTGGLAYGQVTSSVTGVWKVTTVVPDGPFFDQPTTAVRFGWAAGFGAALALNNYMTVKLEAMHVDLGERTIASGSGTVEPVPDDFVDYAAEVKDRAAFNTLRVGLAINLP